MPLQLRRIAGKMHDMKRRHRRRENLWAQAEALMPASSIHFTILLLAKILCTVTRYDLRFLATMP